MGNSSKYTRKEYTYPQWFVDRLVNEKDKELAIDNELSSKSKVQIKCQNCDNIIERIVSNIVSKKTGLPTRPCLCGTCYKQWNDTYLSDTRNKWRDKEVLTRKNRDIPNEVLESLSLVFREKLLSGELKVNDEAEFICQECGKLYVTKFNNRWNFKFNTVHLNHCPECTVKYVSMQTTKKSKDTRVITDEFKQSLYYPSSIDTALSSRKAVFKCYNCGMPTQKYVSNVYNLSTGRFVRNILCDQCSPREHSPLEDSILDYLHSIIKESPLLNTKEVLRNPDSNRPLELDIFYPSLKLAIEVNGSYWHSTLGNNSYSVPKNKQQQKYILCNEKGIHLISIFDVDWWYKQQKVKNILSSLVMNPIRIFARNTVVKLISKSDGNTFLDTYHLDNDSKQSAIYYGLYTHENDLISVMSFGKLRGQNKRHLNIDSYELVRYATIPNVHIVGGASKLLFTFEREYHPKYILAYSDNDYFLGNVYQKLGFSFQKYTQPDYYWFSPSGNTYLPRWKCQPNILRNKYPDIVSKYTSCIEDNVMQDLKYMKVYRTGQSIWVKEMFLS